MADYVNDWLVGPVGDYWLTIRKPNQSEIRASVSQPAPSPVSCLQQNIGSWVSGFLRDSSACNPCRHFRSSSVKLTFHLPSHFPGFAAVYCSKVDITDAWKGHVKMNPPSRGSAQFRRPEFWFLSILSSLIKENRPLACISFKQAMVKISVSG